MMDKISEQIPDPTIMRLLGRRLRGLRGEETILAVAERAGLDRTTVSRAEHGDNPTLLTVLRLLRAYGRLSALDLFIPDPGISPMALIRSGRGGVADLGEPDSG